MGDRYEDNNKGCSSSSPSHSPASDDISLFLRQIIFRSSPSTSSPVLSSSISHFPGPHGIHSSASQGYGSSTLNASSSSLGPSHNEFDDYNCDAEEGLEALLEVATARSVPSRSSSKRCRAAEVHNLSEKRRRSRINEKMKALQNLIPNSNKTDKASMLDEAIEYLKQLQFQVQMLSVKNGLSLGSVCLPEALQSSQLPQMLMRFGEESGALGINMADTLPVKQPPVLNMQNEINSETPFEQESSMKPHLGDFGFHKSSEEVRRVGMLAYQISDMNNSVTNPLDTVSLSYCTQASDPDDVLPACIARRAQLEPMFLSNIQQSVMLTSHLNSMNTGGIPGDDMKSKRLDF